MDPQELLDDFTTWSETKKFNFIVTLLRDVTDETLYKLRNLLVTWLN